MFLDFVVSYGDIEYELFKLFFVVFMIKVVYF